MKLVNKLARIQKKLERGDQIKLYPPLSADEVKNLEDKYGFILPEEYQAFVTCISNGATISSQSGNILELLPLSNMADYSTVSLPFPFEESHQWSEDANFSVDDPNDIEFYSIANKNGQLVLMDDSSQDGITWILIVTGLCAGEVWLKDGDGFLRLEGCSFLDWLGLCVDKKIMSLVEKLSYEHNKKRQLQKSKEPIGHIRTLMSTKSNRAIQWNPPIARSEVEHFEKAHGITLPKQYKLFITEIADGCRNFISPNSCDNGGTFYSLKELSHLANLDKPFCFTENSDEVKQMLTDMWGPYGIKSPIWTSKFAAIPRETSPHSVWSIPDYSVLYGVLPFATYNDTTSFNTQACLVLNGPLKGQIWFARKHMLEPGECDSDFFNWVIQMLEDGAI